MDQTNEPDGQTQSRHSAWLRAFIARVDCSINSSGCAGLLFTLRQRHLDCLHVSPTRRWLTRIVTRDANSVVTLDSSYSRDNAGRITAIDGLNARDDWTYAYDNLARLASATNLDNLALPA